MWCRVALVGTDVSEERVAYIFRVERIKELASDTFFRNVSSYKNSQIQIQINNSRPRCLACDSNYWKYKQLDTQRDNAITSFLNERLVLRDRIVTGNFLLLNLTAIYRSPLWAESSHTSSRKSWMRVTMLRARRSRVRVLMGSLFLIHLILPAEPWPLSLLGLQQKRVAEVISKGKERVARKAEAYPPSMTWLSGQCGILNILHPYRSTRPVTRIVLIFYL
jgi:hypothetical protein